ncbi:MAG: hypothetical protein IIB36_19190 [Gemmatimonadetes bacterium]|nr:hypothetical protein [Gemmatimonadota bacterium]
MKGISSDVIALAAVLGSAAVAGVVTLALASGDSGEVAYECMVSEVETAPHLVVALNSGQAAVVVAPEVQASSAEVCAKALVERLEGDERHLALARFELDRAQEGLQRSRYRLRERLERMERVERVRRTRLLGDEVQHEIGTTRVMVDGVAIELEGLGELLDLELEGLGEALELEFGGRARLDGEMERLDEEMKRLVETLKRLEDGNGR